jgi:Contractile injection system tube protein
VRTDRIADRGFLRSRELVPEVLVSFQYNPMQLTDKRTVQYATVNAPGQLLPQRHYNQGGDRTISFTVHVDGVFPGPAGPAIPIETDVNGSIQPELNKYRAFLYPQTPDWQGAGASFVPLYRTTSVFATPPLCQFAFGPRGDSQVIDCVVTELSVQETLFDEHLAPLRAEIQITLVEIVPYGAAVSSAGGP